MKNVRLLPCILLPPICFSSPHLGHLSFASRSLRQFCFLSGVSYFALNAGHSVNDSNMLVETVSAQVIAVACSSADKTPTRARGDFCGPLREVH